MKTKNCFRFILILFVLIWSNAAAQAQAEILTNAQIISLTEAQLSEEIICAKINSSAGKYDVSTDALIELKKAGVADQIVAKMLEISQATDKQNLNVAEPTTSKPVVKPSVSKTAAQLLREARTVFFIKHSLYPSLSDLESSILKRSGWQKFNLTVTRDQNEADLIIEINREFLTHYNFRVVDAKTNKVLTASGVTSLGGALAGNIADKVIKRFEEVLAKDTK